MPGVMSRTRRRDTGNLVLNWVSGEPDALKGASPVWIHEWLGVQVLSPLLKTPELFKFRSFYFAQNQYDNLKWMSKKEPFLERKS